MLHLTHINRLSVSCVLFVVAPTGPMESSRSPQSLPSSPNSDSSSTTPEAEEEENSALSPTSLEKRLAGVVNMVPHPVSPHRMISNVVWDSTTKSAQDCNVSEFLRQCQQELEGKLSRAKVRFLDIELVCLEALRTTNFDATEAIEVVKKKVAAMEADAWTPAEQEAFHTYMTAEYLGRRRVADDVVPVTLRRCASEFVGRSLRQCWRHFFEHGYHGKLKSASFPDLDIPRKRGRSKASGRGAAPSPLRLVQQ